MKRAAALLLALTLLLSFAGCIRTNVDETAVSVILSVVYDCDDIRSDACETCDSLVKSAKRSIAEFNENSDSGSGDTPMGDKYFELVKSSDKKVASYISDAEKLRSTLEKMAKPKTDSGHAVYDGAVFCVDGLISALADLDKLFQFIIDEDEALLPANEVSAMNVQTEFGGDVSAYIDAVYGAFSETQNNFRSITSCPSCMQETFDTYTDRIEGYKQMFYAQYCAILLNDTLRQYSADQLAVYQTKLMQKYELELSDLIVLQYERILERLSETLEDCRSELVYACRGGAWEKTVPKFTFMEHQPKVTLDYDVTGTIYPNLYHSMDSVVNLTMFTDMGETDVLVEAEVEGFTQEYAQKITLNEQPSRLLIKPALLADLPNMSTAKDRQLMLTVTDVDSGEVLCKETKSVKLMSVNDYTYLDDDFASYNYEGILAWLTPESGGILELRRNAISWLQTYTAGTDYYMESLPGYQYAFSTDYPSDITLLQVMALQGAISDMGVRYNMGAYSLNASQRVLMPDEVLKSRSGICIETALLMASALQSANMHPMIIFTPGHAQVAVETWADSGEYFLIETTTLPYTGAEDLVYYLTAEEWMTYIEQNASGNYLDGQTYVLDCDLARALDIQGIGE